MLINCPRCGFSQPMDQYCAQCGVDMQSFKPKAKPFLKKLFQSGLFQVLLLLSIAVVVGQYIIRSDRPQMWVQKITHSQGVTKSFSKTNSADFHPPPPPPVNAGTVSQDTSTKSELSDLKNQEIAVATPAEAAALASASGRLASGNTTAAHDASTPQFKITYAEVKRDVLAQWISDSEAQGLFQNLQDYSAGILSDFRKRRDVRMNILLTNDKKFIVGQPDSIVASGAAESTGATPFSLGTTINYRGNEGGVAHGAVNVTRVGRQSEETYPAEFDLPKGSIFFMVGALKSTLPVNEKVTATPPFQVFKSHDFMTQKTEFVIIIEPEYK